MAEAQPQNNDTTDPSTRERLDRAKSLALRARRYWKGGAAIFVVACAASLFFALNMKRTYASECVVLVKPTLRTDEQETPQERAVRLTPKLRDTLLTRSRLEPIIKEFKLYPTTVESKSMVDAVEEMTKHIGFKGRDSETFVISFEDEDPERARAITQRLAESTMDDFKQKNMSTSTQQAVFLDKELTRAEQELEEANRALAAFLAAHPEFATAAGTSLGSPRPANGQAIVAPPFPSPVSSDPVLASLLRQQKKLETDLKVASGAAPAAPSETIQALTRARDDAAKRAATTQADLADKRTKLTDQHPDMIQAKLHAEQAGEALRQAEAQLDAAKKSAAGVPAPGAQQTAALTGELEDVKRKIAQRQAELARGPDKNAKDPVPVGATAKPVDSPAVLLETEMARLLRGVGDARAVQEDIRRRSERARLKANATEAASAGQMEIIDAAYKPTSPKRGGRRDAALVGGLFALLAALAYAAARVLLDDTIYDPADIQALKALPVLGVIPRLPPAPTMHGPEGVTAMATQGQQGVSRVG